MNRALTIVPAREPSIAERVRKLQDEAADAMRQHVAELIDSMANTATLASEVANGGVIYPFGIRDRAAREAERLNDALKHFEKVGR